MHTQFKPMSSQEKHGFLEIHRTFCKERFEPDKVSLSQVPLSFFPGYALIEAKIEPQVVELQDGGATRTVPITETSRSYFLYNKSTDELRRKIVPLTPQSDSLYFANWLLGLKLDRSAVVDYLKYYGLVIEGDFPVDENGNPDASGSRASQFLFIDRVDEIPFLSETSAEARRELACALSKGIGISSDNAYYVDVEPVSHWLLGTSYRVKIPCLAIGHPFNTRMAVSAGGFPKMLEDEPYPLEGGLKWMERPLPFYPIEPTTALKRAIWWWEQRQKILSVVVGLVLLAIGALSLVGGGLTFLGYSDVIIGAVSSTWSEWIDGFLRSHPIILALGLVGLLVSLVWTLAASWLYKELDKLGSSSPHPSVAPLLAILERQRISNRKRYPTLARRIGALLIISLVLCLSFVATWGGVFYAFDALGYQVFVNPDQATLRMSLGYAFANSFDWLSIGPVKRLLDSLGHVDGVSTFGDLLRHAMYFSIPLLITANLVQFWNASEPDSTEPVGQPPASG